jgi:SulP family sulfate permease
VKDFFVSDYYVPKNEILMQVVAGVLAALAVVPESIAFALVVGVAPQIGIDTTFVTSIVIGIVGARPGLVNGASGAIAVVIVDVVSAYGEAYMGYTVILAGIIAVVFSLLRLSTLVCLISAPVMVGFVNGLGIIMCLAQVNRLPLPYLLSSF